jgi:hypothetical protein
MGSSGLTGELRSRTWNTDLVHMAASDTRARFIEPLLLLFTDKLPGGRAVAVRGLN